MLTDPVRRDRIGHIRRIAPPPAADVLARRRVISHAHHDHLDLPSLRRVPPEVPVIAPPGCAALLRRRTGHDVIEAGAGASVRVGNVEVQAIPAEHEWRRLPIQAPLPTVGYLIGSRVSFFGDTDVFDSMADVATGARRGAAAGVGLGAEGGTRPHGPRARRPRRGAAAAADRRPDPLGHMRPGVTLPSAPRNLSSS